MYRKFGCKVFFLVMLLITTDFLVGNVLRYVYKTSKYGIFARQTYCLNVSQEDIIVLGASRAAHHYVPSILSDSLEMSCYNAGSDGMCIYYHYGILSSYLKERKPKLVLYDVGTLDLLPSGSATFTLEAALDRLAPHYGEYEEIDSLYALAGWAEGWKMCSQLYRYNSKLVQMIKCHFIPSLEDAGYEAVYGSLPSNMELTGEDDRNDCFEKGKKEYLNKLIRLTRREKIELVFVYSPQYSKGESVAIKEIKRMAEENHILFLDFMNEPGFMSPQFFKDPLHLNDTGARKFSAFLAHHLRNYLSELEL